MKGVISFLFKKDFRKLGRFGEITLKPSRLGGILIKMLI